MMLYGVPTVTFKSAIDHAFTHTFLLFSPSRWKTRVRADTDTGVETGADSDMPHEQHAYVASVDVLQRCFSTVAKLSCIIDFHTKHVQ